MIWSAFMIHYDNAYPSCFMADCATTARYEFSSSEVFVGEPRGVKVFACYLHQGEGAQAAEALQRIADGQPLDASEE